MQVKDRDRESTGAGNQTHAEQGDTMQGEPPWKRRYGKGHEQ